MSSEGNPIRVYVVHAFDEHPDYLKVFEYLESRPNFFYTNCSNPAARPTSSEHETVKEAFRRQIEPAEIVVLPVTVFSSNPVLVSFQVELAKALRKPLLAVKSFGETLVIKKSMLDKADDIVDWNDRAITEAIKRLARHDQSGQWEVVEFKLD